MNEKILIVDDEIEIADLVEVYLKNEGFLVFKFYNATDALRCIERENISLAVLDVMLPDMDGFTLCKQIRQTYFFPILMLTAKIEDMDKITGLSLGADDYMTKPFSSEELLARIRALSRRQGEVVLEELVFDDLTFHLSNHNLTCNGKSIHLGYKEAEVMKVLMHHLNMIVSKEMLMLMYGKEASNRKQ